MNGTDITEQFFSETYNHVVKGDVNVTVTIRKKTYGLTVKDFVGGTIKAEFEDEGVVTDVSAGGRVPENATLKIYEPVLDEGYELVYVSLNGSDIKDQFKDGIYSLTMKEDVMLVVKAKEIDKMFKLTIDEIEGGSIDVQVYVGGDLADVPADGNIKNGTMLMISEPVLEDGYELVSVMLNEEDITALFEEGVYFHTMRQDVTISVKTNYVSGVEEEQAGGGTDIYAAALEGLKQLAEYDLEEYTPAIILLTDGVSSGDAEDFLREYESLGLDVPVFSIMFGDADPTQLEALAQATNARVFDGREDLVGAFRSVKGYN